MNILQMNTMDIAGGAAKVAFNLHKFYQGLGHQSRLAVGQKVGRDAGVIEIPKKYPFSSQALINLRDRLRVQNQSVRGLCRLVDWIAQPGKHWDTHWGIEDFHYLGSRHLLTLADGLPDIVHAHNLHGGYFDLRFMPELSRQAPWVITLHDEWMLTGHCAYTMGCERWECGCGSCPDLSIYPSIKKDATACNWQRKRKIYQRSNLYIATPSQWLMDRVKRSMLMPAESRVISNGVDLKLYYSGECLRARHELGLPADARIILGVANKSRFKDNATMMDAMTKICQNNQRGTPSVIFIALGGDENMAHGEGGVLVQNIKFISDTAIVAEYFRAADIFLHAAKAENFPNTIIESFACGTPVIATDVGGISEQVEDGVNGFLVPQGDSEAMANRIIQILIDDHLRVKMGNMAAASAVKRFGLDRQANDYINWYKEILENHALSNPH